MSLDATYQKVCAAADIASGEVVATEVNGVPLAIVSCGDGEFRAVYDECSHAQIPLSEGEVDGCTLECWLHGSRFDLRTGQPTGLPATQPVPVYPVEVHEGEIYVSLVPSNGVEP
jgi:3-phenylpropionate/trans-cinnamate dioxygenase ferredoxin component